MHGGGSGARRPHTANLNAAPSWKPLPYLFTLPYAVFGHDQMWLWMITAVAVSLSGVVFAARIAYRVVSEGAERRWPAYVAGAKVMESLVQAKPPVAYPVR